MNIDLDRYDITAGEKSELTKVLANGVDYNYNEIFAKKNSYKTLFKDAPDCPQVRADWFIKFISNVSASTRAKTHTLTTSQEYNIFLQYNWHKYKIAKQLLSSAPDIGTVIYHLRNKNIIRDKITTYNYPLVITMSKNSNISNVDFEELIEIGNEILLNSIEKFNTLVGRKFSTYLCTNLGRAWARESKKRFILHNKCPYSVDNFKDEDSRGDWVAAIEVSDIDDENEKINIMKDVLNNKSAGLTELEQTIIERRYLYDQQNKKPTFEELGKELNCSKSNLSRLERIGLGKLKSKINEETGLLT